MVVSSLEQAPSHRDSVDGWPGIPKKLPILIHLVRIMSDTCTFHMISSLCMGYPCVKGSGMNYPCM